MPETYELAAPLLASLPSLAEIRHAAEIVYGFMPATPQYSWPLINQRAGAEVWIKHENHTPTGAFKVRGGILYMDWLEREHPEITTVISATRGNHGQSIAFAAAHVGIHAIIVVPVGNSREKNLAMQALGAELVEYGDDFQAASEHAQRLAEEHGFHRVPSYDPLLVGGVATYALEFLTEGPPLDTFYGPHWHGQWNSWRDCGAGRARPGDEDRRRHVCPCSGIGASFAARRVVEHASATAIADGVACRKPDARALEVFLAGVDRIVEVTDDEVADAMRIYFSDTHNAAKALAR